MNIIQNKEIKDESDTILDWTGDEYDQIRLLVSESGLDSAISLHIKKCLLKICFSFSQLFDV